MIVYLVYIVMKKNKNIWIYKVNCNLKLPQFIWNSHTLLNHNVIEIGDVPASFRFVLYVKNNQMV